MRYAVPASVSIHALLIVGAYLMMQQGEPPDEAAGEAVSVEIISLEASVSNDPTEIESASTETLAIAGAAESIAPAPVEAAEPAVETAEIEPVEPVEPTEPVTETAEIEPVEVETDPAEQPVTEIATAEPTSAEPVERLETAALDAIQPVPETIEPLPDTPAEIEPPPAPVETTEVAAAPPVAAPEATPVTAETQVSAELLTAAPATADLITAAIPTLTQLSAPAFLAAAEPVAEPVPDLTAVPVLTPRAVESAEILETALLAPVSVEDLVVAPVPRPRPDRPEPVQEPQQKPAATPQQKPAVPPAKKPPPARKRQATIPSNAGNEGNADTEAQAGRQAGAAGKSQEAGQAEVSRYEGQVQRKVARALRFPSGARDQGVAQVQFVVAASGAVSQVRVVRSAGSAALDSAAIEAVQRAAPFPPIPAAAGRSSWTFAMPLTFKR